jgi:hypothetical protein
MPRSPVTSQSTTGGGVGAGEGSLADNVAVGSSVIREDSSDTDDEDDERIIETSEDGRWQKINHRVCPMTSYDVMLRVKYTVGDLLIMDD